MRAAYALIIDDLGHCCLYIILCVQRKLYYVHLTGNVVWDNTLSTDTMTIYMNLFTIITYCALLTNMNDSYDKFETR